MVRAIDLSGRRFGKLLVLHAAKHVKVRSWVCECDCKETTVVTTNRLTSGHTTSCGCKRREIALANAENNRTHGFSRDRGNLTYRSWLAMRYRCKPGSKRGDHYSARGITICKEWDSFEKFLADMGERPCGTTLDRIKVNGNYEPGNCRWAPPKTQQRNKRRARRLVVGGLAVSAMDVADELGIKKNSMQAFFSVAKKLKEKYGYLPNPEDSYAVDC